LSQPECLLAKWLLVLRGSYKSAYRLRRPGDAISCLRDRFSGAVAPRTHSSHQLATLFCMISACEYSSK
jgi:hypothetical protein